MKHEELENVLFNDEIYDISPINGERHIKDCILEAAQSYAAILKLASEIEALIEAGFVEQHEPQAVYNGAFTGGAIGFVPHNSTSRYAGWLFWKHPDGQWVTLGKIPEAANTRPALKAVHDELKKWGE